MTLDQALPLLATLDTDDKLRLIDFLARELLLERGRNEAAPPAASLRGALKQFGPSPSLDEMKAVRREMWARLDEKA